ncbi:dephospho-CoA kinase [candidate division WOR-1 bacterium RIFOXYB2_FULL_42_35]|uniref:Dephospho-CoA kinase n=1 Tax=candidate division WOR-1 bacterium RIFOXYC2_FULL_41_25 TaxID=1802586 RepID=A0A1F4TPL6_UNCSA|nr:MAG: dephospho-CoA kinase [candidate division WOR-1 bacterium RIFOXYB2_FULL_42_35]OGC24618.1 MAG: dephospho-CoA kinase [candidate division WOR-1 bacterium RIFOXYA2_FULL_41_14]OGC34664.1 MAG: dephospho-CoA kinase [candidate division WOR-1 bacterium RIFOXYC2_FULL_41_25]OGC43669.1 MAG: dephospho-CoA kinase [candidate division WOR-1 bacterium RIFOXYD2_FULL_41_8]
MSEVLSPKSKTKIIGLTGPIGAGKDVVAKLLAKQGAYIIDADKLAHSLYPPQSTVWRSIVKEFGSRILKRGGEINRRKLAEIVFSNKHKLQTLNKIVHPALKEKIRAILKEQGTRNTELGTQIVVNAAVLKEIGLLDVVDEVCVVMASKATRLKRLLKKGLSKQVALKRINAQLPHKDYLKIADVVIKNEGTVRQLKAKTYGVREKRLYYRTTF